MLRLARLAVSTLLLLSSGLGPLRAAEIRVMTSGGLTAALKAIVPAYQQASGDTVVIVQGPSMGTSDTAIPVRLGRGELADLLLMVGPAIEPLVQSGQVRAGSRVDLADSRIGLAVRAGAPRPAIATLEEFRAVLLAAPSIAYSDSASGVFIEREMYRRLGLQAELAPKSRMIVARPVGEVVAEGGAAIGFQQLSELLPVSGITVVGPIPDAAQSVTTFSAAIPAAAHDPAAAARLIAFMQGKDGRAAMTQSGLDPKSSQ